MPVPEGVKRLLRPVYRPIRDFRESRERSVRNIARANDRRAFETIFGDERLVDEYLAPERLEFYEQVAAFCEPFAPRTVVDVGCGTGHLLAALERRLPGIERLVGIDFAAAAIARLQESVPRAEGFVASVYDLPLSDDVYELVVCMEVLEHLERPDDALAAIVKLCATSGRIVVTVPDGALDTYEGHRHFWDGEAFEALLARHGRARTARINIDLIGVVEP
jgi:2-polyprenyl-3-methyl-5-hydroxy-6-metoxy-1,4-benzoquinol methylase